MKIISFILGGLCVDAYSAEAPVINRESFILQKDHEPSKNTIDLAVMVDENQGGPFPAEIWENIGLNFNSSELSRMRLWSKKFDSIVKYAIYPNLDFIVDGKIVKRHLFKREYVPTFPIKSIRFIHIDRLHGDTLKKLLMQLSKAAVSGVIINFQNCSLGTAQIWHVLEALSYFLKISILNFQDNNIPSSVLTPLISIMVEKSILFCDISHNFIKLIDVPRIKQLADKNHPVALKVSDQEMIVGKGKNKKRTPLKVVKNLNENTQAELKSLGINLE